MKKLLLIASIITSVAAFATAQTYNSDLSTYKPSFDALSSDLYKAIPLNSTIGLQWSDAYIGQLIRLPPHLGVGTSLGFTTIPMSSLTGLTSQMGVNLPSEVTSMADKLGGFPIPSAAVEARLGGFILPFDFGFKAMTVTDSMRQSLAKQTGLDINAKSFGVELRVPLLQEKFFIPDLSVGVGYSHTEGVVGAALPSEASAVTFTYAGASLTNASAVKYVWDSNAFDLNLQMSKQILYLFTPYLGAGVTFAKTSVGGGLAGTVTGATGTHDGAEITADHIYFMKSGNATIVRAFGGLGLNLFILHVDLSGMYNFTGKNWGAQANARIQL